jgi:hypothetical protein
MISEYCNLFPDKNWSHDLGLLGTILLIAICSIMSLSAFADGNAVLLSTKEDTCFKSAGPDSTYYIHFRANGTYSRIDREHMFVAEIDRGTWTQDSSSGWITMKSSMHSRNIEAGPLTLWTWHSDTVERLPQTHAAMKALLSTNNSPYFESRFIETNFCNPISTDFYTHQISRNELSDLLKAIELFESSSDTNHFHVAPVGYKGVNFLLWRGDGNSFDQDLSKIKKYIDDWDENEARKGNLGMIYTVIDKKTFEEESGRGQDFIFYPQMNQPRKKKSEEQK